MPSRVSNTPARSVAAFSQQPQELPLNQQALVALENLKRHDASTQNASLQETLDRAAKLLYDTVVQVNDRASEEKDRRQHKLQRLRRDGEKEEEGGAEAFQMYQQKVENLTKAMDESIRKIVDDQQFPKNTPGWIQHVIDKSQEFNERNQGVEDGDNGENEQRPTQVQLQRPDSSQNGTAMLHAAQSTAQTEWNAQSLTERYARNNTYADFYKLVWDSKHPGEHPPPLPDLSMWFAAQEGRGQARNTPRSTQRSATAEGEDHEDTPSSPQLNDDTEIQMTSDVRSVKCPLTMRYFEEPMTSTLCPHSFEKSAILTFIRESDKRLPLTDEQETQLNSRYPRGKAGRQQAENYLRSQNAKCVQCPVPGCKIKTLTADDLRFDNVLLRMTKRAQEAEKREKEEDDNGPDDLDDDSSDDGLPSATQRKKKKKVYAIGSSPVNENRRRTLVKPERAISVVPNSQSQSQMRSQTMSQGGRRGGRGGFIEDDDEDEE